MLITCSIVFTDQDNTGDILSLEEKKIEGKGGTGIEG